MIGYWVDRAQAFWGESVVAILAIRQRGARSRILLSDGSLVQTLTRCPTIQRKLRTNHRGLKGVVWPQNG
ncbi:MAG: hypothetical protein HYY15_00330 [Candidatus Omnitrophica bacterium]|nr:hypothetical protein [Candidatus Omnitrophota bacterium]